jgi:hypothetical protein
VSSAVLTSSGRRTLSVRRIPWHVVPAGVAGAALLVLYVVAFATNYSLRIIGDVPTFIPIIRRLSVHPFEPVSPFLASGDIHSSHASPYMQFLGFAWRLFGGDAGMSDQLFTRMTLMLAFAGLLNIGLLASGTWAWAKSVAGPKVAWLTMPVALAMLGPVPILWATDLSFHGLLYSAFYPQNAALACALWTLVLVERPSSRAAGLAVVLAALTVAIHPLTGLLLMLLLTVQAAVAASRNTRGWWRGSAIAVTGLVLGLAWPAYSVLAALEESGLPVPALVALIVLAPALVWVAGERVDGAVRLSARLLGRCEGGALLFAEIGAAFVVASAVTVVQLLPKPFPDPIVHSNHLALYWVEDRWRWIILLGAGYVGVSGLARLARRGRPVPFAWMAGTLIVGIVGAVASFGGIQIPIWYRFVLLAQLPLALGVAVVLASRRFAPHLRLVVAATLVLSVVFGLSLVVGGSKRNTYFATPLQPSYSLGSLVPPGPGVVASDPYTSFFVPALTGHPVLTVTKGHVGSALELGESAAGYQLLHTFFASGSDDAWWHAAQLMYLKGVRLIVFDKYTTLEPATLADFSNNTTNFFHGAEGSFLATRYNYRCRRTGTLVADTLEYSVYRLDGKRLGL